MSGEELLAVSGVYKKYAKSLKLSLKYGMQDMLRELVNKRNSSVLRNKEFWALQDINFTLKRGECLGLIGHNGAGKTTLLRLIAGLQKPDRGEIRLRGKMDILMNVSSGISPTLSGRENVLLKAQLLGIPASRLGGLVDEVVDFAEIAEFIDTPVAYYSSGMKARLGFGIATLSRPDILILDEVLSVGDLGFRLKCYDRIAQMMDNAAVIFVSHSMHHIKRMSHAACVLNKGKMEFYGDPQRAIELYRNSAGHEQQGKKAKGNESFHPERMNVRFLMDGHTLMPGMQIPYLSQLTVAIEPLDLPSDVSFRVVIRDGGGMPLIDWNSAREPGLAVAVGDTVYCDLGALDLTPDRYLLSVFASTNGHRDVISHSAPMQFEVTGDYLTAVPLQRKGEWEVRRQTEAIG